MEIGGDLLIVTKRNGTKVPYEKRKIYNAINKAVTDVYGTNKNCNLADVVTKRLENRYRKRNKEIAVEEIQDDVEKELMKEQAFDVAKAYIRYRYKKEVAREARADFIDAIGEKLEARNVQNQNANVDEYSFGGRIGEASSVVTKQYALDYIISEKSKANHLNNEVYIHDLDSYAVGSHNCLSIPFDKLLANGFNTRQTDVRPAGSISTAFQLVAVIFQLQSLQQFG